jgi:hypothetical protein
MAPPRSFWSRVRVGQLVPVRRVDFGALCPNADGVGELRLPGRHREDNPSETCASPHEISWARGVPGRLLRRKDLRQRLVVANKFRIGASLFMQRAQIGRQQWSILLRDSNVSSVSRGMSPIVGGGSETITN